MKSPQRACRSWVVLRFTALWRDVDQRLIGFGDYSKGGQLPRSAPGLRTQEPRSPLPPASPLFFEPRGQATRVPRNMP